MNERPWNLELNDTVRSDGYLFYVSTILRLSDVPADPGGRHYETMAFALPNREILYEHADFAEEAARRTHYAFYSHLLVMERVLLVESLFR